MDAKEQIVVCEMWLAGILLVHESRAESSQAAPSAANIVKVLLPVSKHHMLATNILSRLFSVCWDQCDDD